MSIQTGRAGNRLLILTVALLLALQVLVLPSPTNATVATSAEMQQVCQNWLTQKVYQQGSWAGDSNPQIIGSHEMRSGDTLLARWYDVSPRGYVLVPVLKEMQPVKAYSDEYNLDESQEGGFLTLMREVLSQRTSLYARKTGSLDAPQSVTTEPIFGESQRAEWDRLSADTKEFHNSLPNSMSTMTSVGPLLTTSWHQRAPYNNLCPMGDGDRTVVGCVATAISQILNYWQWPESGYGSHTYTWEGDYSCDGSTPSEEITADFSNPYDWANIPDSCDEGCTAVQEDAVAELCYEAGVAVDMDYGACGSGAYLSPAANSFSSYFKYSPDISVHYRLEFDLPGWFALLRDEIDNGRVCDYFISRHSIVLDGYRDDYGKYEYHMNYGWGGSFTTWFVLDSLYCYWEPDSLCPSSRDAIVVNIHPQTEPILSCSGMAISDPGGNGIPEPGEQIDLTPTILNSGLAAGGIVAVLSTNDPYIYDDGIPPTAPVPNLDWGEQATSSAPLSFTVLPTCPDPHVAVFELLLASDGGYEEVDTLQVYVGTTPGLEDDVESGQGLWTHHASSSRYEDQWHIDTYRQHSGTSSWKAGGIGVEYYANNSDACLVTQPFLLPNDAVLTFWHWIAAEKDLEYDWAFDGASVYVSSQYTDWTIISPVGGYSDTIYEGTGALSQPTPCYSGWQDWSRAEFDLSAFSGVVQIMFRFCSDAYVTDEGWYVDDITVTTASCCGAYTGGFTGNADCDIEGKMNLADISDLIDRIYLSKAPLCCEENGNVDGDTENKLALSDITKLIDHVYLSKQPTAACQ